MAGHALLSPSSAHRWMVCPGSVVLEQGIEDKGSIYADEGTAAHFLAEQCLRFEVPASASIGQRICLWKHEESESSGTDWESELPEDCEVTSDFIVDQDMADYVQQYIAQVYQYAGDGDLLIEQRLPITPFTNEPDAYGTADAVVILDDELQIHDLKYGRGEQVDAEHNPQLMIYAAAAYEIYGPIGEFERVRMVIHQPRKNHLSEWDCSIDELQKFANAVDMTSTSVESAFELGTEDMVAFEEQFLDPGEKQCRWCKAKNTPPGCPALNREVAETTGIDFADLDSDEFEPVPEDVLTLEQQYAKVELVEAWAKSRREAMHAAAERGESTQYKLVSGRRGNRTWGSNLAEAEDRLKRMRYKKEEMYDFKLRSPAQIEKMLKDSPRRWVKLAELIQQPDGKPQLVPMSDPRPNIAVSAEEFANLEKDDASE